MNCMPRLDSRVEFTLHVEDILDCVEPFIDPQRPDWRQLLGEELMRRFGTPPPEGSGPWAAWFQDFAARLRAIEEELLELRLRRRGRKAGRLPDQPEAPKENQLPSADRLREVSRRSR